MDIVGWFSKLLEKCGIDTYVKRCEFSAHIAWGLAFGFAGFYWHWSLWAAWFLFVLWDEFYCDHHWKVFFGLDPEWPDLLWDLGSKLFGVIVFVVLSLVGRLSC